MLVLCIIYVLKKLINNNNNFVINLSMSKTMI